MPKSLSKPEELCRHKKLSFGRFDSKNWYVGEVIADGKGGERLDDVSYFPNFHAAAKAMLLRIPNDLPLARDLGEFAGRVERAWAKVTRELGTIAGAEQPKAAPHVTTGGGVTIVDTDQLLSKVAVKDHMRQFKTIRGAK